MDLFQRENISLQRKNISLTPYMLPLVCPLDGGIASQMCEPAKLAALSSSRFVDTCESCNILAVCVSS